jgi:hypothetical protein
MSYSWGVGFSPTHTEVIPVIRPPIDGPAVDGRVLRSRAVSPDGADLQQLAAELAPMVDLWRKLLSQHVPDRAGRCRTCTKGGTGLPAVPWPCSLHAAADLARRRHDADLLAVERMGNERVS